MLEQCKTFYTFLVEYHQTYELVEEGDLQKVKNFFNGNKLDGKKISKIEIEKGICNKFSKILTKKFPNNIFEISATNKENVKI